jgi:hypothetical protein
MIWKVWGCVRLTWFAPLHGQPSFCLPSDRFTSSAVFSKRLVNVNERVFALSFLSGYKYSWSGMVGRHSLQVDCSTSFQFSLFALLEFLPCRLEWIAANNHWWSRRVLAECRRLFVLACVIRGKCIQMMFKFESSTYIDCACCRSASHAMSRGAASVCAVTPLMGG